MCALINEILPLLSAGISLFHTKVWINTTFQAALKMTLHPLVLITNGKRLCTSIKQFSRDLSEAVQSCYAWAPICFVNRLIVVTEKRTRNSCLFLILSSWTTLLRLRLPKKWPKRLDVSRQINSTCYQAIIITLNT